MKNTEISQHLAWPETRLHNLLTWLDRDDMEGWDNGRVMKSFFDVVAEADGTDEAHY